MVGRDILINIFRNKGGRECLILSHLVRAYRGGIDGRPITRIHGAFTHGTIFIGIMSNAKHKNHNYTVHFQLSPSLNLEQEEVLCQVLGTASPQPSPTEESPAVSNIGNTGGQFLHPPSSAMVPARNV